MVQEGLVPLGRVCTTILRSDLHPIPDIAVSIEVRPESTLADLVADWAEQVG